ncbi:MAG TPA: ABC transporter substrate-binding protein [Thermodesulforhabdus norvegica]|uniref:ABC transporter substrate-binding protein n=1 Tax=Thermodesulforhabdus norvegica TaxID=39841 RepID=A0A7C0WVQ1_9BACT|nr:amino acid ABC transporter substrate-binding protein [Deltaproteobacteria bacterium]MBW2068263.1 amino acid ABC transporter substrate-binding protein [Deltaproteobacteria bacterium]HDL90145.1 ABC transporter substrate-binding protein [Thermodesulforhabdus norvegica]
MKRVFTVGLCIFGMLLGPLFGLAYGDEGRNYFKVGVITSLSGDLATGGNVTKRGYDLWAQEVNRLGGIEIDGKKYPVKLVYADAQSEPSAGASAAERLATQEKVDFILGPYSSGVTLACAPVLEKYKIPMITGSAESPIIWKQKFRYTFGTIPPVNYTGSTPMKTLASLTPPPKTAIILGSNDAFSKATAEAFKASAEALGIKILKYDIVPQGQDLTPYMAVAKATRPDIIAFGGHDEELINLVKALRQINYTPKALLMHYGVTEPAFVEALGKDAEGVFGATVWTSTIPTHGEVLWPDAKSYAEAALKAFNVPADYTQAGSSAAGIAFQVALAQIKATPPLSPEEREALVEALEKINIRTFYGTVNFATEGQYYHANVGLTPLTVQIQNGHTAIVGPPEYAESPAIYPMKPWNQR